MATELELLSQMEKVLDALLANAKLLSEAGSQVVAAEELQDLQRKQGKLLEQIQELDKQYQASFKDGKEASSAVAQRIREKLKLFEKENQSFIANLSSIKGLIHFNGMKVKGKK